MSSSDSRLPTVVLKYMVVPPFALGYRVEDEIIGEIKALGSYDHYVINMITRKSWLRRMQVPDNAVILDVGANIGVYSIALAHTIGPNATIVAAEGNAETVGVLAHNIRLNKLDNVRIFPGIVARDRAAYREVPIAGSSQSEFIAAGPVGAEGHPGGAPGAGPGGGPKVVTIDDIFPPPQHVHLIKIDVNGGDLGVLLGGRRAVERCRPVVLIEFVPGQVDRAEFTAFRQMLEELQYRPYFFRGHSFGCLELLNLQILEQIYDLWSAETPNAWMNLLLLP